MVNQSDIIINFHRTINANETQNFDLASENLKDDANISVRDYYPYRNLKLVNKGNASLELRINNMRSGIVIPSGTIYEFEYYAINHVSVKNLDSANSGEYYLTLDTFDNIKIILKQLQKALSR